MLQQWRGAKCACLDAANVDELKKNIILRVGKVDQRIIACCVSTRIWIQTPRTHRKKNAVHQVCGIGVHSGGKSILGFRGHTVYIGMIVNVYENLSPGWRNVLWNYWNGCTTLLMYWTIESYFIFWERSHNLKNDSSHMNWMLISYATENALEFLTLLSLPSEC